MSSEKPKYRVFVMAAVLVLIALAGCLPIRPEFSHQGRLLTSTGDPVPDGDYSVVYKFYNVASGGSPVHTTAAQVVSVKEGRFNITVGASPEDINPEIFAQPAWVEVVVKGETLAPRIKLLGSPYAFSLAPGAVVQGPETIARTFSGQQNTGSTFTAWNTDTTATGGNALLAINQAAADGAERDKVAALQAIAAGGVNDIDTQTGAYGAIIKSQTYRGMYVRANSGPSLAPYYAAVFDSEAGIELIGGGVCDGCTLAYIGTNAGDEEIQEGSFVTVVGVEVDPDLNVPVMQVRPVLSASDPVIGVARGAVARAPVGDHAGTRTGGYDLVGGPVKSGGYLSVVVSGLVQVQVGSSSNLTTGDWVAIDGGRVSLAGADQQGVARLLSDAGADGFAWILFTGK